jgi:hypothetical protein
LYQVTLGVKELFMLNTYESLTRVLRNTDQAPVNIDELSRMSGLGLLSIMAKHGIVFAFKEEVKN